MTTDLHIYYDHAQYGQDRITADECQFVGGGYVSLIAGFPLGGFAGRWFLVYMKCDGYLERCVVCCVCQIMQKVNTLSLISLY